MLAGAGKSLIDRSNGCTFVIGSVQQRPTKIHLGNVGLVVQLTWTTKCATVLDWANMKLLAAAHASLAVGKIDARSRPKTAHGIPFVSASQVLGSRLSDDWKISTWNEIYPVVTRASSFSSRASDNRIDEAVGEETIRAAMSSRVRCTRVAVVAFWLFVTTASSICSSARASDKKATEPPTAEGATLKRILANWKTRQEDLKSLHFVWDSRLMLPKGAGYWQTSQGNRIHRRSARDTQLGIPSTEVWIEGEDRFRTEFSAPQFDEVPTLGSRFRGTLNAGRNVTLEIPPEDLRPRATIWKDHYDHESTAPLLRVLLLGCRPGDWRATGRHPELFAVLTEHAIIDNVHCVKLEKSSRRNQLKETCWVDPGRDDVVIRWEIGDRARPDFGPRSTINEARSMVGFPFAGRATCGRIAQAAGRRSNRR